MRSLLLATILLATGCAHVAKPTDTVYIEEGGGGFIPSSGRLVTKSLLGQAEAPIGAPSASLSQYSFTATAPQTGAAGAECMVSGGTTTQGVCLGGYEGTGNALFLGISPDSTTRTANNYTLLGNGNVTTLNAGTTLNLDIAGAAQWQVLAASFNPVTNNSEDVGTSSLGVKTLYGYTFQGVANTTSPMTIAPAMVASTASSTVAPLQTKPTVALDANDLLFDSQISDGTSKVKWDVEGDQTNAGTLTLNGTSLVMNSASLNTITSNTTDANTTGAAAAMTFSLSQDIADTDLGWAFKNQGGTNVATITEQGGVALTNTLQGTTIRASSSNTVGTIVLSAGTGTATTQSGAKCVCTDSTANASVKCNLSGTTLTATGTGTDTIVYICL